jgi:16S rRNA (cytidine1402-2'-O)-methyltransferase
MKLYVVGTPIGNLGDFSPRAADVLRTVDFIAAEDTRVSAKLTTRFDIHTPLISYHEHNKHEVGEKILMRLLAGESCALVTDAGMPIISDPGEELVRLCRENQIPVESVPGPAAFVTALAASGLPGKRFCFEGFLSVKGKNRRTHLESLHEEPRTMLFYEAPHKLPQTLQDFAAHFGERPLAICRELTKIHEEVIVTTCAQAAQEYAQRQWKGEIVLVLGGKPAAPPEQKDLSWAVHLARDLVVSENVPLTEASKRAASLSGHKKSQIYAALLTQEEDEC